MSSPFKVTVRLDFSAGKAQEDAGRIGRGKIALLEAINRCGSISAAAREQGMSYRRAWMLIDQINSLFDRALVTTAAGGTHGGGAVLTAFGHDLIAAYRQLEADVDTMAASRFAEFAAHRLESDQIREHQTA